MDHFNNNGIIHRGATRQIVEPAASQQLSPEESAFTWEQAVRVLRKNQRFALAFILLSIALVTAGVFYMKDTYQPVARVQIDPASAGMKPLGEIQFNTDQNDENYLETQAQILQSEGLAVSVIRDLHLDRDPEFVGKKALKQYGADSKPAAPADSDAQETPKSFWDDQLSLAHRTPLEAIALGSFRKKLSVSTVHNSRLLEVSFASHDPVVAQNVVNALVTQFVRQNYKRRYANTMESSDWLSQQLNDLRKKTQESSQAVADYSKKYDFAETDEKDVPLGGLIYDMNHELSQAQADRIESEAYVRMIDDGQTDAIPQVRDDQLYQTLTAHYVDVRGQLAQARAIYGDANSNVLKLTQESDELSSQLATERNRMANKVKTAFNAAAVRERMLSKERERLRAQMGDITSHLTQYRILKNEALANSDLYNTLHGRLVEAGVYAGLGSGNIHIIDLAPQLRLPTAPQRGLIIAIGAMISIILAIVLSFVKESFNNSVRTPDDILAWVGLPSLAMIPPILSAGRAVGRIAGSGASRFSLNAGSNGAPKTQSIPVTRAHSAEGEAMRDLRTALMLATPAAAPQVILVTSASAGEGKTTVSINLAAALAERGKTCLVEGDLRRPMAAATLKVATKAGIGDVVAGTVSLDQALSSVPGIADLSLLAAGRLPSNPADLISSERMRELIQEARGKFDYVVVDSPPVIPFSDARMLSAFSDAVVLVGRYSSTTRRALARAVQLLDEVQAPIVGVVVNGIDFASPDYQYFNYGFSRNSNGNEYAYLRARAEGPMKPPDLPLNGKKASSAHA
ncbi:MAG TPA: polysaccharide biosynthesis tyrosine autokinase [Candidatus Acidoferrales bacterium]